MISPYRDQPGSVSVLAENERLLRLLAEAVGGLRMCRNMLGTVHNKALDLLCARIDDEVQR